MSSMATQEIERLCNLARICFPILGMSYREAEAKIAQHPGYFSRAFQGRRDFRLEHIFHLCEATGLHPAEFFHRAYPVRPEVPSETERQLARVVALLLPDQTKPTAAADDSPYMTLQITRKRFESLPEETRQTLLACIKDEGLSPGERASRPL